MRMRGTDKDGGARNPAFRLDILADIERQFAREHQGIQTDQCDSLSGAFEYSDTRFTGVVEGAVKDFSVTAWFLHPDGRRNITLGKARFEIAEKRNCEDERERNEFSHSIAIARSSP